MLKNAGQPKKRTPKARTWEERMKRYTVVFPREMISEIKKEARRSGRTHSGVVVDAVRKELAR